MCDEYDDCVYVDNVKIEPVYNGEYYTVTFIDGVDGSVISEVSVPEGGSANLPLRPCMRATPSAIGKEPIKTYPPTAP